MNGLKNKPLTQRIRWRIRGLWALVILMLVYMVAIGEAGLGDSRVMTDLAQRVSRQIYFGGLVWLLWRIACNKKLLADRARLKAAELQRRDERRRYLRDKSGGWVVDALLALLLFATCTTALWNMPAFYVSLGLLLAAAALKAGSWWAYNRLN